MRSKQGVLVVGAVLALLTALVSGAAARADAAPKTMTVACAKRTNGLMSYAQSASACGSGERAITLSPSSPTLACANTTKVYRVDDLSGCGGGQLRLTLPTDHGVYFCALRVAGDLRYVTAPAQCRQNEVAVVVPTFNRSPTANGDSYSTDEDTALAVSAPGVLGNDGDPDGDPLTAILVSGPSHAAAFTLSADGSFSYTPAANYNGPDGFTYKVNDGKSDSGNATVTLTVRPVNDAPVAQDGSLTTDEGVAKDVTLQASDVDGDSLTYSIVSGPSHGSLSGAGVTRTYTPSPGYFGSDSFTFRASDGSLSSNVATVSITVDRVNHAPVANDDSGYSLAEGSTLIELAPGVLGNDTDPDGDALHAALVSGPAHASSFSLNADGSFSYTPAASYNGPDSFTYKANDGSADSNVATVSITVTPVNAAPVANADSATTDEDTALNGSSVLTNDSDADGDPLTAILVAGPAHASSFALNADGAYSYTPAANFNGADSFTYKANDGSADSNVATVSITVNAVDDAPTDIALSSSSVDENQPSGTTVGTLSTTDVDAGDTFTYGFATGTGDGDNGSFRIVGNTLQTNVPFDFEGKSSYSIRVRSTDGGGLFTEKQFTVSVNDQNEAPTDISLSSASIDENRPAGTTIGTLSATDQDAGQTHAFTLAGGGCGGVANDNGSFSIAGSALESAVSFDFEAKSSYTICVRTTDSGTPSLSFDKLLTVAIGDVNDAPVANADSYTGAIGNTLAVVQTTASGPQVLLAGNVVTANDTDQDATFPHTLSAVAETVTSTHGGTATINSNGSFVFLPAVGDENASDTFTYHVTDGSLVTPGTVTIHIDNFRVWYVDNARGSNGDGRSTSPFDSLGGVNGAGGSGDADGAGDTIFVYAGSGSYGGGLPLEASQTLWGEKHGLAVDGHSLVSAGSTAPVITNAAGAGIGLADGVDVEGVDVAGTRGDGIDGAAVSSATVGTTTGVDVSGAGGDGVDLSGAASGNISIASGISGSAGHSVAVSGRTGGTTVFSGSVSDTGTGIQLQGNTGGTINLTGGVAASTGTSNAFVASGGGTVNVTGSANTLSTTTGTALSVTNTTIGSSGLDFRSISSNGAASGIVLSNTGSSGGLSVTGVAAAGSGGTIQGSTGPGISLSSTSGPSLARMNVTNGADDGIRAAGVSGLSLTTMNVSGNGNAAGEDGLDAGSGINGVVTISNSTFTGSADRNASLVATSGTLNLAVALSTFSSSSTTTGGDGLHVEANGPASAIVSVTASTFTHNRGDNFAFGTDGSATGTNSVTFNNNTVTGDRGATFGGTDLGAGVSIATDGSSATGYTISGNTISGTVDAGIAIGLGPASTGASLLSGTISSNTIGSAATPSSGSAQSDAVAIVGGGNGSSRAAIVNNTLRQWGNSAAIRVLGRDGTNHLDARIQGNTLASPGSSATNALVLQAGGGASDTTTMCADVGGLGSLQNALAGAGANGATDFRLREVGATSSIRLPDYVGGSADTAAVVSFLQGRNAANGTPTGSIATPVTGGFLGGPGCTTP